MVGEPDAPDPSGIGTDGTIPGRPPLLVCGMPGSGKTTFCRYLADERGYTHYELSAPWLTWPLPTVRHLWAESRARFLSHLRLRHARVVLDWSCPSDMLHWLGELVHAGARPVWFDANLYAARRLSRQRGERVGVFDTRVRGYLRTDPAGFWGMRRVQTLGVDGSFLHPAEICRLIGE